MLRAFFAPLVLRHKRTTKGMEILYIVIGLLFGIAAGFYVARSKSEAQMREKLDDELGRLRAEAVEKTSRRVEQEGRQELMDPVRRELTEKFAAEVRAEVRAEAEEESRRIEERSKAK